MDSSSEAVQQSSPEAIWRKTGIFALLVVSAAVLVEVASADGGGEFVWAILSLPVSYLLAVTVHTAGHVIAGYLAGFRVTDFAIGPLRTSRYENGLFLQRNTDPADSRAYTGSPTHPRRLWARALFVSASGPLANCLLAIMFAIPLWIGSPSTTVKWCLIVALCASVVVAVNTLIPVGTDAGHTDGWRIAYLLRNGDVALRAYANDHVLREVSLGHRPRDWDQHWIELALRPSDGSFHEVVACQLAYYWAWDHGDFDNAANLAVQVLALPEAVSLHSHTAAMIEAAFCAAAFRRNTEAARDLLDGARTRIERNQDNEQQSQYIAIDLLRAEAALSLAEGEIEQVKQKCQEWQSRCAELTHNWPGLWQVEREWIESAKAAESEKPAAEPEDGENTGERSNEQPGTGST